MACSVPRPCDSQQAAAASLHVHTCRNTSSGLLSMEVPSGSFLPLSRCMDLYCIRLPCAVPPMCTDWLRLLAGKEQAQLCADLLPGRPGEGVLCPQRHLPLPAGAARPIHPYTRRPLRNPNAAPRRERLPNTGSSCTPVPCTGERSLQMPKPCSAYISQMTYRVVCIRLIQPCVALHALICACLSKCY